MRVAILAILGFAITTARADTTLTNQTDTFNYTSNTSANVGVFYLSGTSSVVLDDTASVNVSDSSGGLAIQSSLGGAETIVAENSGSGNFVFTIGSGAFGRATGSTINFVVENTGSGATSLSSNVRIGNGGDGNDLSYWAFYDGNDFAATATSTGGVLGAATSEYNDGGHDTDALNLSKWAADTTGATIVTRVVNSTTYDSDIDYTNDSSTATYSGTLTGNAEKHGIRFSNSAGASLDFGGNQLIVAGILDAQGSGTVTIADGYLTAQGLTQDLVIDQNNTAHPMTISANITGSSSVLEKVGVGTLVLSGYNTYAGTTYINQGTLQVDGTIATSNSVLLQQGATLSGTGAITPKVTAETATSVVAPGDPNQLGELTLTNLVASNGLTLDFRLDGEGNVPGINNDVILTSGLTLNGTVTINLTALDPLLTDTNYYLMGGGGFKGTPTFEFNAPTGYAVEYYDYDTTLNEFYIELESVPEPSTWMLLGLGVPGVVWRMRRAAA